MKAMKSRFRKLIDAAALSVLLLGADMAGIAATTPAEAARGIRPVATVCTWDELDWAEMSDAERRQWVVLGWSQGRWDTDDENAFPASWSKDWDELSLNERAAAWALGYTPNAWDSDDPCP
jgi:hypothetical protein